MIKLNFLFFIFFIVSVDAQIGIGTDIPNATLDISKNTNTDIIIRNQAKDGLLLPKLTKLELANKLSTTYTNNQIGVIVYVTEVDNVTNGQSINQVSLIDRPGFYYLGDDLKWKLWALPEIILPEEENIYTKDSDLTSDRIVNIGNKKLQFSGNNNEGFVIGNVMRTITINTNNKNIGIGTTSPTTKLDISGIENIFRLEDGSEGEGKLMESDSEGNAIWATSPFVPINVGKTVSTTGFKRPILNTKLNDSSFEIELTKGEWLVNMGVIVRILGQIPSETHNMWFSYSLGEFNSSNNLIINSPNIQFLANKNISSWMTPSRVNSGFGYAIITGTIPIRVLGDRVKLYGYTSGLDKSPSYGYPGNPSSTGSTPTDTAVATGRECYIFAIPLD